MGMYAINNVVVGTKMPRDEFEEEVGEHPWEFREDADHDLIVVDGAEKQWDEVVVGVLIEQIDCQYPEAVEPTDLRRVYAEKRHDVDGKLRDVGLEGRNVSIYLIGAFM